MKKDNYSVNFSDQESNPSLHRRDSTSSISIPDVDLTPDHDWSINAERIKETKAMVHKLGVTLEELYNGKTRKLAATRDIICSGCNGKGGSNVKNCTGCKGRGVSGMHPS